MHGQGAFYDSAGQQQRRGPDQRPDTVPHQRRRVTYTLGYDLANELVSDQVSNTASSSTIPRRARPTRPMT
jgi:hypothetical protein